MFISVCVELISSSCLFNMTLSGFLFIRVLNEFILKNPNLESKKDQRELQVITAASLSLSSKNNGSGVELKEDLNQLKIAFFNLFQ